MNAAVTHPFNSDDSESEAPLENWELLTEVVMALVGAPEEVLVTETRQAGKISLLIRTAPEDVGKVIGKNGETISLLRSLFGRIAASQKRGFVELAVVQPKGRNLSQAPVVFRRNTSR